MLPSLSLFFSSSVSTLFVFLGFFTPIGSNILFGKGFQTFSTVSVWSFGSTYYFTMIPYAFLAISYSVWESKVIFLPNILWTKYCNFSHSMAVFCTHFFNRTFYFFIYHFFGVASTPTSPSTSLIKLFQQTVYLYLSFFFHFLYLFIFFFVLFNEKTFT